MAKPVKTSKITKCPNCAGKGWVVWLDPDYGPSESRSCQACKGTGKQK